MHGTPKPPTDGPEAESRRLRVLYLNTRDSLGADVAVHVSLARAIDRAQARVWVATSMYEAPLGPSVRKALDSIPALTVLPLNLGRPLWGQRGAARLGALLHNVRGVASLARLAWLCRRERIDVIHVTDRPRDALFGLLVARLSGSRCLIHAHTSYDRCTATALTDWALRRADAVVGVSRFTANTYVRDAGLRVDRVYAVHNAVDSRLFPPDVPATERSAMRMRLGVPTDVPLIGCVARLIRWKGQSTLLDTLVTVRHSVPNVRLVLVGVAHDTSPDGQGDYKDYLVRRIAALGLDDAVTFAGFMSPHEMPRLYAALDVLVHPAAEEPFGLVLTEAMASARPVVAVGTGGVPEIIRDGVDGLLVPREQSETMAAAIVRVLRDPALAGRLARAGRERVLEAFSMECQTTAMLAVYRRVAKTRASNTLAVGPSPKRPGKAVREPGDRRTVDTAAEPAAGAITTEH